MREVFNAIKKVFIHWPIRQRNCLKADLFYSGTSKMVQEAGILVGAYDALLVAWFIVDYKTFPVCEKSALSCHLREDECGDQPYRLTCFILKEAGVLILFAKNVDACKHLGTRNFCHLCRYWLLLYGLDKKKHCQALHWMLLKILWNPEKTS